MQIVALERALYSFLATLMDLPFYPTSQHDCAGAKRVFCFGKL